MKQKRYYQDEPKLNEVYSKKQFSQNVTHELYVINSDRYANTGTHWFLFMLTK